jgi:transcriptional activator SPT7
MVLCSLTSFILTRLYCHSAKSAEPPPPYPPPQPFVSLTAEAVKNQIGLLRGYFEHRLAGLDTLLDDPQNPAQAKLGPLGQVIRPSSAAIAAGGGSKKKAKPKDGTTAALAPGVIAGPATGAVTTGSTVAGASVGVMSGVVAGVIQPATPTLSSAGLLSPLGGSVSIVPSATAMVAIPAGSPQPQAQTPKKKKAAPGVGTGVGGGAGAGTGGGGGTGKKRGRPPEGLPPVVVASA